MSKDASFDIFTAV